MHTRMVAPLMVCLFLITGSAIAQDVILYRPVVQPVAATPVVTAPVVSAPVVVARPAYTSGYAVPVAPSVTAPVVVQRPTLYDTPSVAPVVSYSPAVPASSAAYVAPVAPAPVAVSPVVVRPKVYVPGRPIYNFFQAITP
ncbi:hypothetical protein [Novipirellula caenicola]|uniref:Uncharacterized protein n=1 Tax=Novipirellula caenicola TaxID=1536901 RepID=A0ABP9VKU5_9BACT